MLSARSVQNIDIFKKPKIKELILSSNSWDNFSNNINQFGNDPENNKKRGKSMYSARFKKLIEFCDSERLKTL